MRARSEIQCFIDSASLHGAFAALILGGPARNWTEWDLQSLWECTYLLLFDNVRLVPGPSHFGVAVYGHESRVVKRLPHLVVREAERSSAERQTSIWLSRWPNALSQAWHDLSKDSKQLLWSDVRRRLFWENHIRSYDGLFEPQYLPHIARTLSDHVTVAELQLIHSQSKDPKIVQSWTRQTDRLEEACQIANMAYIVSSLIRGKYHEYVSRAGYQLISHPHRQCVAAKTLRPHDVTIANSEQHFVRMIIGSALLELRAEHRIGAWIDNILLARRAIAGNAIALPQTIRPEDAEEHARNAATRIGLTGTAPWKEAVLTWTVGANLALWLALTLGPWFGLLGGAAAAGYRVFHKKSIGEDLVRLGTTKANFARLGEAVPGRIERTFGSDRGSKS